MSERELDDLVDYTLEQLDRETEDAMDVTREEFEAYEEVRQSGEYNMTTDHGPAALAAGLSHDRYFAVWQSYDAAREKYGVAR